MSPARPNPAPGRLAGMCPTPDPVLHRSLTPDPGPILDPGPNRPGPNRPGPHPQEAPRPCSTAAVS